MAFQNQCGGFYGIYPCLNMEAYQCNFNTQKLPISAFSEKAKAFTIDALLSEENQDRKPVQTKQMVTSHTAHEQLQTTVKKSCEGETFFTPNKQESFESTIPQSKPKSAENYSGYYKVDMECGNHIQSNLPLKSEDTTDFSSSNFITNRYPSAEETFYSPMMTGWFFRPNECYSPMTVQGQSTPIGLKSIYQTPSSLEKVQNQSIYSSLSTPDSKNNSWSSEEYFTPAGRSNLSSMGSRKVMSSHSRQHDRPHPYLSPRHQIKSELKSPITQEPELNVEVTTLKSIKGKRQRTAFTQHQLQILESEFEKQQYLVGEERCVLAESLDLTVTQVKVWFQNRRIKWRKEQFEQGKIQQ